MADRQKILGIGGLFFKSADQKALASWYSDHLGIDLVPDDYETPPWQQQAGSTVFAPFGAKAAEEFGAGKHWMINFRVADLEGMIAQLEADGIAVERDPESYPNGAFAWLADPEGNRIELWQETQPNGA